MDIAQAAAPTLSALARQLRESARAHKRSERFHREAAQIDQRSLEELLAFCRAAGIEVIYEGTARGGTAT